MEGLRAALLRSTVANTRDLALIQRQRAKGCTQVTRAPAAATRSAMATFPKLLSQVVTLAMCWRAHQPLVRTQPPLA